MRCSFALLLLLSCTLLASCQGSGYPDSSSGSTIAGVVTVGPPQSPSDHVRTERTLASSPWKAGRHYFLIDPAQELFPKITKNVVVTEVFSYGCPACNRAEPFVSALRDALPSYAEMRYLPVSFRPDENFPLYQRAFYTAKQFGVARDAHEAMFDAVWRGSDVSTYNLATGSLKREGAWPDIADMARFYADFGVDPETFISTSQSFVVETKMARADRFLADWHVRGTPTIVVNGKYRLTPQSAGSYKKMIDLALWLVDEEHSARQYTGET